MLIFISGGVRSGKSSLGEKLLSRFAGGGRKVYLATTEPYDEEMAQRIRRHREDRAGKGYVTLEKSRCVGEATAALQSGDAVLLDCLGALASNEMFGAAYVDSASGSAEALADRIFGDIVRIRDAVSALVVISNEVFSDGVKYDGMTSEYVRLLGLLHRRLAAATGIAVECAAGIHIVHKGVI